MSGLTPTTSGLLLAVLLVLAVSQAGARPGGSSESQGSSSQGQVYQCMDADMCFGDSEAVYAFYKNETYCCNGGDAIMYSITGVRYKFVASYFYSYFDSSSSDSDGDGSDGSRSRRSADGDGSRSRRSADDDESDGSRSRRSAGDDGSDESDSDGSMTLSSDSADDDGSDGSDSVSDSDSGSSLDSDSDSMSIRSADSDGSRSRRRRAIGDRRLVRRSAEDNQSDTTYNCLCRPIPDSSSGSFSSLLDSAIDQDDDTK